MSGLVVGRSGWSLGVRAGRWASVVSSGGSLCHLGWSLGVQVGRWAFNVSSGGSSAHRVSSPHSPCRVVPGDGHLDLLALVCLGDVAPVPWVWLVGLVRGAYLSTWQMVAMAVGCVSCCARLRHVVPPSSCRPGLHRVVRSFVVGRGRRSSRLGRLVSFSSHSSCHPGIRCVVSTFIVWCRSRWWSFGPAGARQPW